MPAELISQFDRFIRRDPAQRGLIATEPEFGPLCPGHLDAAARHLAEFGGSVLIVTGFFIPKGDPPAAETDGPPGALLLARVLADLGINVLVGTDQPCWNALSAAAEAAKFPASCLIQIPHTDSEWCEKFLAGLPGRDLTHVIAIERVGPSHTERSLIAQSRSGPAPGPEFLSRVPPEHRDHCHNMRGDIIDEFAGEVHSLFDLAFNHRNIAGGGKWASIGIGDGGNEIGMGCVPWEELTRRLKGDHAAWIPCRIATDWNIVAGTSNWGAQALAAAVAVCRNRPDVLKPFDSDHERRVIEHMVAHGPAVDGVTRRREATVDGIPFLTYIQPWEGIRRAVDNADREARNAD